MVPTDKIFQAREQSASCTARTACLAFKARSSTSNLDWSSTMTPGEFENAGALPCEATRPHSVSEIRHQIRYPLRAPVKFEWIGRDGVRREAAGHSRDISEAGAYVRAKACPPVGSVIRLVIKFPFRSDAAHSSRLEMSGRVVRTELLFTSQTNWGFAVA